MRPRAGQVWQKQGFAFFQIEHAGDADANASNVFLLHSGHSDDLQEQTCHAFHDGRVSLPRQCWDTHLLQNSTVFHIHDRGAQVGPTEVTTNVFFHGYLFINSPLPSKWKGVSGNEKM